VQAKGRKKREFLTFPLLRKEAAMSLNSAIKFLNASSRDSSVLQSSTRTMTLIINGIGSV
jgi:hypothetical protein